MENGFKVYDDKWTPLEVLPSIETAVRFVKTYHYMVRSNSMSWKYYVACGDTGEVVKLEYSLDNEEWTETWPPVINISRAYGAHGDLG